jgi:pheromone shutdown protein TraB
MEEGDEEKTGLSFEKLSEKFSSFLTAAYAEQQNEVAEKCGVSAGEAWRTAFEAASNAGTKQVPSALSAHAQFCSRFCDVLLP